MKLFYIILALLLRTVCCFAQDIDSTEEIATERQMESLADNGQTESDDDSYLQVWEELRKRHMNLNSATEDDLEELHLLTDLQIASLLNYRRLMGKLVDIHELQAIPCWDINTIHMILPFVTTEEKESIVESLKQRLHGGTKTFMYRSSGVLETAKGFLEPKDSSSSRFLGSPLALFLRYKYNYKNLLQWGVSASKDAGEQFFRGAQKYGFDFYSAHLFIRKVGKIKELALGDFTVNMGQGLIQWQSLAYNKSSGVILVKRQSPILRPYNSAGEYNFHRGAGITMQFGKWETTTFVSFRRRDAVTTTDSSTGITYVTSLETTGLHRTPTEVAEKNREGQIAFGGSLQYNSGGWKIGFNTIHYQFSIPIQKRDEPYNLYAFKGSLLTNYSIDYNYTHKNVHFFGEIAADNNMNKGTLHGMLISLGDKADASVVYRNISPAFQSMYSNAFTESSTPNNEAGLYTGLTLRPFRSITIDAYADVFKFPWLKYLVDVPSFGKDYFVQLTYKPDKNVEIYTRYRNKAKQKDDSTGSDITKEVPLIPQQNWRINVSLKVSNTVTLRARSEMVWYDRNKPDQEQGFSGYVDAFYKPAKRPWSANFRLQYFDTEGSNSSIYSYQNDVLYGASIPAQQGTGVLYYINLKVNVTRLLKRHTHSKKKVEMYLRWSQTLYANTEAIGSGLDEIDGTKKTDFKCQFLFHL